MSRVPSRSKLRRWFAALAIGMLVTYASLRSVRAEVFTPTLHKTLQAVHEDGKPLNPPAGGTLISLIGVVINNPWDMLSYELTDADPAWQVFIQADADGDFGGTALYMRMNKSPYIPGSQGYTESDWVREMHRINYPGAITDGLRRGDLIQVEAKAPGAGYGGKYNINEQHQTSSSNDFDIKILARDKPLQAKTIVFSDLIDPISNNFIFAADRLTGAEYCQGSLVHLENLMLVSNPSQWVLNGEVEVRQGDLSMPLKLGLDSELLSIAPTAETVFSLTAILDQEDRDTVTSPGFKDGYRLWLTSADDFRAVPEPGTILLAIAGGLFMYPVVRKHRQLRK